MNNHRECVWAKTLKYDRQGRYPRWHPKRCFLLFSYEKTPPEKCPGCGGKIKLETTDE